MGCWTGWPQEMSPLLHSLLQEKRIQNFTSLRIACFFSTLTHTSPQVYFLPKACLFVQALFVLSLWKQSSRARPWTCPEGLPFLSAASLVLKHKLSKICLEISLGLPEKSPDFYLGESKTPNTGNGNNSAFHWERNIKRHLWAMHELQGDPNRLWVCSSIKNMQ